MSVAQDINQKAKKFTLTYYLEKLRQNKQYN